MWNDKCWMWNDKLSLRKKGFYDILMKSLRAIRTGKGVPMKKKKKMAVLVLMCFLLGGCGTPLYEMTEEEQNLIVSYAANAVAKNNLFQKDGYVSVRIEEETEEPDTTREDTQQESSEEEEQNTNHAQAQPEKVEMEQISLRDAVGLSSDISVSCEGVTILESYEEMNDKGEIYFYLDPKPGNVFLMVKIRLKNTSDKTVQADVHNAAPKFFCCYNGTDSVEAEQTFALKALPTYKGNIKANKSVDTVLLFQIPEAEAKNVTNPNLQVEQNGTTKAVKL